MLTFVVSEINKYYNSYEITHQNLLFKIGLIMGK